MTNCGQIDKKCEVETPASVNQATHNLESKVYAANDIAVRLADIAERFSCGVDVPKCEAESEPAVAKGLVERLVDANADLTTAHDRSLAAIDRIESMLGV